MLEHRQLAEKQVRNTPPSVTYELFRKCGPDGVGSWCVGCIRYMDRTLNQEIRFRETREFLNVVGEELYAFFQNYLPSNVGPQIISAKDAEFRYSDVVVKDVRMTAFHVSNYVQRCILIINEYKGNLIRNVSESSFISNIFQMRDTLVSKIIGDVLLPMVNMGRLPENAHVSVEAERQVRDFLSFLRAENNKLGVCLEYLQNYVNDSPINDRRDDGSERKRLH